MCIDYTCLNKACPKDEYPLSCICQIVDFTTLCELLSFLDAYSSYHQISLAVDDEEKKAFITPFEIFCYTEMVFDLKNGVVMSVFFYIGKIQGGQDHAFLFRWCCKLHSTL
jgi:hypothetical protein